MRIAVICHYFVPEVGAPSARIYDMAKIWVLNGHSVTVVTNFPNHPTGVIHKGYEGKSFLKDEMDGLKVVRCRTYATPNSGFIKKTMAHLFFMMMAILQGGKEIKDADVIMVSSPTLFSVISAWWLGRRHGIKYVFDVRDLWPGIFIELGVLKNSALIKALERLEMFLYSKAGKIVTVSQSFAKDISERGIDAKKIHYIPNGVDLEKYKPSDQDSDHMKKLHLKGKFVVLYCGGHGISHALATVVDAANLLKDDETFHFLFVGDGAEKSKVVEYARTLGVKNVTFLPSQPNRMIAGFYNNADVCLVPLRKIPLFKTFIPSKMFEIMGCQRPIIASVEGESAEILKKSGAAIIVSPEDSKGIVEAILEMKRNPQAARRMGESGRKFAAKYFDREKLAESYLRVFSKVVS